jgi:hypothetical protein
MRRRPRPPSSSTDDQHFALMAASAAPGDRIVFRSAMSGARAGSRAPRSIHCSQRRRSAATAARASMRLAGAPASASSSPTGLWQRNCLPGCRRASSGRRREWRRAESCARCGLRSKRGHGRCTPIRLRRAQISPAEIIPPRRDVSMIAMARISISSVEYDSGASAVLPIVAENGGDFRDYCAKLGDHRERVTITGSGS